MTNERRGSSVFDINAYDSIMITYLDMVITVCVVGAAIFLAAALVFRLLKVGRQDLTLVDDILRILTSGPILLCLLVF